MIGELTANGIVLDLKEGVSFPFNYSIADMKEPQKRKRNYSRTVVLPGTQNNMDFFFSAYSLSLSTVNGTSSVGFNFDPTIRIPATYKSSAGVITFIGLLQLNQVEIDKDDYTFECTLFSNFIEIYLALGDLKVAELGWSEYNHDLTIDVVMDSWDTSVVVNGSNTSNFSGGNPLGFGYHYGLVDYGYQRIAPKTFRISDIVPMVYKREVLLKCLEIAGMTISSDFIDSVLFRKLLLGFGGGEKQVISPQEATNRRTAFFGNFTASFERTATPFLANNGIYYASFSPGRLFSLIDQDTGFVLGSLVSDIYQQYDIATGQITVERTGTYNLSVIAAFDITVDSGTMVPVQGRIEYIATLERNGSQISESSVLSDGNATLTFNKNFDLQINAGDVITFSLKVAGIIKYALSGGVDTLSPLQIDISDTGSMVIDLTSRQSTLNDGDTVELSRFIPEMKASDFVAGVFTEFNLYASDPDLFDVVNIEPLTDFYSPTSQFDDWTQLVDHSKPKIVIPSSNIDGKFYKFKWAEDNDYDNKRYRDRLGIGYGDFTYEVESTWQKGDRVYQLPFAQTIPTDELTPLVIPRIISLDGTTNAKKPFKGKPRVYIWNGMKTGGWRLTSVNGATFEDLTSYPSVHHFDNWEAPTFDLNWGLPQELQYTTSFITNANLFNNYHRTFIKEITGRDSKIVQLYVKLNSQMINTLDFGRLKMINGVLFRLNEIKDFDDNIHESTFVELVKVVAANKPKTFGTISTVKPAKQTPPIIWSPPVPLPGTSPVLPGIVRGGIAGVSSQNANLIRG